MQQRNESVVILKVLLSRQLNVGPVSQNHSAAAQRQPAEEQDELHYATVCFSQYQAEADHYNMSQFHPRTGTEEEGKEEDYYSAVRFDNTTGAPG